MLKRVAQASAAGALGAVVYYTSTADKQTSNEAYHLLQSVPRVGRVVSWAASQSVQYCRLSWSDTAFGADELSTFHTNAAKELTEVCSFVSSALHTRFMVCTSLDSQTVPDYAQGGEPLGPQRRSTPDLT